MTARLLLLLCALLGPIISLTAQVKEVVLCDNFADNSTGWTEGTVMYDYIARISSGTYFLEHHKNQGSRIFDVPVKMDLSQNFFIETIGKITDVGKQPGAALGIVWGKGRAGYLTFAVSEDGKFYVRRIYGKKGEYLLGPTKTKFLHANRENKIRVQFRINELMFFINDKYVGHLPQQTVYGNKAGIILYGRQRTEIYNFGAYGTKNYDVIPGYSASVRVSYYEIEDGFDSKGGHLGNGDCKVQPGEIVQLAVTFKNLGKGPCKNLFAKFYAISDYVSVVDQDVVQTFYDLQRSQSQTLNLKFKVSNNCSLERISFKVDITDELGRLAESVPLSVPLYTRIAPINKDNDGQISFTFNVREQNYDDINNFFPITLQNSRNVAAVMIGVEGYANLPKAIYATNDAKIMRQYLIKVMNVPQGNVVSAANQNATLQRIKNILRPGGELATRARTNVIFYFSGFGICDPVSKEPYIMLYDSKDSDVAGTCFSVKEIVSSLQSIVSGNVICIFETSFAGLSRNGKSLGSASDNQDWAYCRYPSVTDNRTCVLYATSGKAYNPMVERTSHGMFTHYLLTAMHEYGKNRNTLDVKTLFDFINQSIDHDHSAQGLGVIPRMDCKNRDGIILLK